MLLSSVRPSFKVTTVRKCGVTSRVNAPPYILVVCVFPSGLFISIVIEVLCDDLFNIGALDVFIDGDFMLAVVVTTDLYLIIALQIDKTRASVKVVKVTVIIALACCSFYSFLALLRQLFDNFSHCYYDI